MIAGIWKLPIGYLVGVYGIRWTEYGTAKAINFNDETVNNYVRLHPEKFSQRSKL